MFFRKAKIIRELKYDVDRLEANLRYKDKEIAKYKNLCINAKDSLSEKNQMLLAISQQSSVLIDDYSKIEKDYLELSEKYQRLDKDNKELTDKLDEKIKENDLFQNKIKELEVKLAESMTDKYLVRKVKPGRPANTLKMKVKTSVASKSNVKKFIDEEFAND